MIPSDHLMEILNEGRECLESPTKAFITRILANDLTTPGTRFNGSPDQLVSERKSESPLPYIIGTAGVVLILAVVLFIVR